MTKTLGWWLVVSGWWAQPQPTTNYQLPTNNQVIAMPTEQISEILQAKYRGNNARVEELLKSGPALNIFEAAATGQADRVRELIAAHPALLNAYAPDGFHPLGLAAFFGNKATVEVLLHAGADVNQQSRESMKVSALHSAAAARRPDIVEILLAKSANPNLPAEGGVTVFHEAGATGQIEVAEMLLKGGGDINATDGSGRTPLAHALDTQHEAMAGWLRAHGGR
jgi:ankyrin repeat protein